MDICPMKDQSSLYDIILIMLVQVCSYGTNVIKLELRYIGHVTQHERKVSCWWVIGGTQL